MVKFIFYLTMASLIFLDWLVFKLDIGSRYITWLPEILSMFLMAFVLLGAGIEGRFHMDSKYLVVIAIYMLHVFMGLVFNDVKSGTALAGLRSYFKFLPFFMLPAVYEFSEKEINKFLVFMLFLALLQFPVTLYQRFIAFADSLSGDPMGGTLGANTSGVLTFFLVGGAAFLIAFYLRNRIKLYRFTIALFLLLVPTGLNETKITFVLLPAIFILPFLFSARDRFQIKKMFPLLLLLIVSFVAWKASYDFFQMRSRGWGIDTFMTTEGRLEGYAATRFSPIMESYKIISEDALIYGFGLGAGNVSGSFSESMAGEYNWKDFEFDPTTTGLTAVMLELGMGGLVIITALLGMLFLSAVRYANSPGYFGILSLSMISVVALFGVSFLYFAALQVGAIVYPFFFLSGFIACGGYYSKKRD